MLVMTTNLGLPRGLQAELKQKARFGNPDSLGCKKSKVKP
jgi:hypothetical protein